MAGATEPDGKNSLLGEFLVSLVKAPEHVQEAIIINGLKHMRPYSAQLIQPYPMLSHLVHILNRQSPGESESDRD